MGANLGGGNQMATASICGVNTAFNTAKNANFAAERRRVRVFRYAISAAGCDENGDDSST